MNRRQFLLSSAAGAAAYGQKNQPVRRPNVLIVMASDLGAWMLSCYGNKEIRTPNIDNLARGGLRFTNAFCGSPAGAPSHATFFTGRVPNQHGIRDSLTGEGQNGAPPSFASETMLSDVLAQAGYSCGYAGQWQMGNDVRPGHGYKYAYTLAAAPGRTETDPQISLNGEPLKEQGYAADLITRRAGEFLDAQSAATPFLLTAGYPSSLAPNQGYPGKFDEMYSETPFNTIGWEDAAKNAARDKDRFSDIKGSLRSVAGAVTALDDQIGVLLRKLRDRQLWDDTLIVFTADNGALLGRHGLWGDGLASEPPNMYEEVVRVPFLASWPGKIPTGEIAPEMVSFYDVLPTLCQAAAVAAPSGRNLTGRSFLAIAKRDPLPNNQPWRNLVFGQLRDTWMAREPRYKLVLRADGKGPNELFDISADPREKANRYDDPQFTSVRQRLTKELEAWRKRAT